MMDAKSRVLYVGKAKDLKKRLTSYTRFSGSDHNKTTVMLSQVIKVNTILTNTEKEALINSNAHAMTTRLTNRKEQN